MPKETAALLAEAFCTGLGAALEMMTGERPEIARSSYNHASMYETEASLEWWRQEFSLSPNAVLALGAHEQVWTALGSRVLRAEGIPDSETTAIRDSNRELMNQALSAVATAAGAGLYQEVTCGAAAQARGKAPWTPQWMVEIRYADAAIGPILFAVNPSFFDAPAPAVRPREEARVVTADAASDAAKSDDYGFDLLRDVELPVAVSFGKTRLPLKDVLKLGIGSIVELNRTLTEPVDVVVNNCVVARGEVVVVDGNYGVRVLQVVGRKQRMEAMK